MHMPHLGVEAKRLRSLTSMLIMPRGGSLSRGHRRRRRTSRPERQLCSKDLLSPKANLALVSGTAMDEATAPPDAVVGAEDSRQRR